MGLGGWGFEAPPGGMGRGSGRWVEADPAQTAPTPPQPLLFLQREAWLRGWRAGLSGPPGAPDPTAHLSNHFPSASYHLLSTHCVPDTLWGSIPGARGKGEKEELGAKWAGG